jgi:hypothetical protein
MPELSPNFSMAIPFALRNAALSEPAFALKTAQDLSIPTGLNLQRHGPNTSLSIQASWLGSGIAPPYILPTC